MRLGLVVPIPTLPAEFITNLCPASTLVVPITKLPDAASCPTAYFAVPDWKNFSSASTAPSKTILASVLVDLICSKSRGLVIPIPTLPAEVIRIFSVAAVVSVPPAFVQRDKAVGELRLVPASFTIAILPASLIP